MSSDWHNLDRTQLATCYRALAHFGPEQQTTKAYEELGEVIQALAKVSSRSTAEARIALAGEIADAFVMLVQMAALHNVECEAAEAVQAKLDRVGQIIIREAMEAR